MAEKIMKLLSRGFPIRGKTAPVHKRFVGLYYWSAYWQHWDKVISIEDNFYWFVQEVDSNGIPYGEIRRHCTTMWVDRFANQPFDVYKWSHES